MVVHDSRNIVALGTDDQDIYEAVKEIEANQGGLVAVFQSRVLVSLPFPLAGLLSDRSLEEVADALKSHPASTSGTG